MATRTFGTNATSSLTAVVYTQALIDADIAAMNNLITEDDDSVLTANVPEAPGPKGIVATGTTNSTVTVTSVTRIAGGLLTSINVGARVLGVGIPAGAFVAAFSGTTLTLSVAATNSVGGGYLLITQTPTKGQISRQSLLHIPGRGVLRVRYGDVVGVDNTGWPILVSGASVGYGGKLWTLV